VNLDRTAARQWAGTVVRLVLAGIWAWASISKIGDPRKFTQAVRAYDATPEWLSKGIGYGLPVLELCLAILLVLGLITRYAAAVSAGLFVVFIIGIVQAGIRDIKLECGCFGGGGTSTSTSYTLDILRDVGLLVLAVFLIVWPMTRWSVDEWLIKSEMVVTLTPKQAKLEKNVRRYRAAVAAAEVELKHKQRYVAGGTAVVLVLVLLVAIGVQGSRAKIDGTVDSANASAKTGVTVGNAAAPVTVDVYEDLQCPICNQLEQSGLTTDFDNKIKATTIKVNYHIMSFLDSSSNGNKYSSRAANAAYCASDTSVAAFQKFHNIAYGKNSAGANNQPAEGSNGAPDSTFVAWGKQAGITSADFSTCVSANQHAQLVVAVTDDASKAGVSGTPTVFVAGKRVGSVNDSPTVATIDAAITSALSKAKSTAAPSTSPAATSPSATGSASAKPSASASVKPSASVSVSG
jgi:protein-disulfide isomerase/uncharacterized membrane protein YphA (DoxX/SURF4 family)